MVRCERDEVDLLYINHQSQFTVYGFNEEEYDPKIRGGTDAG